MKQLVAAVVLLVVGAVCVFLYQNTMRSAPSEAPDETACTLEAKVCPDGTTVGRTGPNCSFVACPLPNVAIADADIAFAIPAGYAADENAYGADPSLVAAFAKPSALGNPPHSIIVRMYPIPAGKTANEVILENTRYQPSDMQAEDFERFTQALSNGRVFRGTVIERFEGHVTSAYYLVRERDVLRFEVAERDVRSWTDPNLVVEQLPEHQALLLMLAGLQAGQ